VPRAMKWYTSIFNNTAIVNGGTFRRSLLPGIPDALRKGSTVTRILLSLWMENDTFTTLKRLDLGIGWIDEDAFNASAFPDPEDENERFDWIFRDSIVEGIGPSGTNSKDVRVTRYDLRSQRICRAENDLLIIMGKLDTVNTGGVFFSGLTRVLLRLP